MKKRFYHFLLAIVTAGMLTACSQNDDTDVNKNSQTSEYASSEQTFEVELSAYDGSVYFVPFLPSDESPEFHMQIVQNGNVLTNIPGYLPEELNGETFTSLDTVSFYDINYDAQTDIVLIQTYGDTSFVSVYFCAADEMDDPDRYFIIQPEFSDDLTAHVEELSISGIRSFLSGGKRNGTFSSYQEAYESVAAWSRFYWGNDEGYNLIYFDEDDIPELALGKDWYYVSLYTYKDGTVYTLMDMWPYGAFGNMGYEYLPGKNLLRNYNHDFAGAIMYETYASINEQHVLEVTEQYITFNFDDINENGYLDPEEEDSLGYYSVTYLNGEEISSDAVNTSGEAEEYEYIRTTMSLDELKEALN